MPNPDQTPETPDVPISAAELERAISEAQAQFENADFEADDFDEADPEAADFTEIALADDDGDEDDDDEDFEEDDDDDEDEIDEIEIEVTVAEDADFDEAELTRPEQEASADEPEAEEILAVEDFDELELKAPLRRAIKALGFKVPTPIQAQALPVLLGEPVDFIGQAMTGTGKTATYGLPILQNVKPGKRALQALILTPTRELALQISQQLEQLGQNLDLEVLPIYGGADHGAQLRGLQQGTPVAVATPGRLLEHIRRGTVSLDTLNTLVLDEADQMMSLGFREEVEAILAKRPPKRCRIWMFSATLSKEVRQIAEKWLRDPKMVLLNAAKDLPPDLRQEFFATQESNKPEVLSKLLDAESPYGLIFCQTKSLASELTTYLAVRGYPVACLHGDKDQHAREAALTAFREHEVELLVCTDVAARGLDIPEVTHVINYSLPRESDVYLHRVGRTARSGKAGKVLNLISPTQRGQIRHLQDVLGTEIPEGQIPSRRELGAKKLDALLARFLTQDPYRAMDLLTPDWIEALGEISRRELAGRFISLLMPEIFGQEPASKQVLGKRPLEEVEDDENDEDFERIIAAAQKRKAYQSIAPRTRLSEREAGKQLDHASEKRSPRTPSDKTSRELRRL
ncbi:MAG: DEAD/DEAH box helicase, partial [Candidatus Sericytochromatia bacterium]